MKTLRIASLPEHSITSEVSSQLQDLLEECFPGWLEGRTYYKQLPHFRLMAMDAERVVGQVGVDGRIINVGGEVLSIFGVIELAVRSSCRGRGIGTMLLSEVERIARSANRDFLVVMADRHDIYLKEGYRRILPARTRLLAIENRQSVDVVENDLSNCFMVKPLTDKPWPKGTIDMLGYVF